MVAYGFWTCLQRQSLSSARAVMWVLTQSPQASFNPPKVPGIDDVTGEPLTRRPDDTAVCKSMCLSTTHRLTRSLLRRKSSANVSHRITSRTTNSSRIIPTLTSARTRREENRWASWLDFRGGRAMRFIPSSRESFGRDFRRCR